MSCGRVGNVSSRARGRMQDSLDRIDVWACRVPLPTPLDFGAFVVASRQYVALRVRTVGGLSADVIGHSRGSPIDVAIADLLAPRLIGTDPTDLAARREDFFGATIALERDGVLGRAWSLLELALQGVSASARQEPAWKFLGGQPRELPVQLVEGYGLPNESDEAFAERLVARTREGYTALKLEGAHYRDWRILERRLRLIRRQAPDCRLVVDFAWSWKRAREHADTLATLADLGINWIEDIFPRDAIAEYMHAAKLTDAPIGCGDEATRAADLLALLDAGALQVVRLDATALGGYGGVLPLAEAATQKRRRVSFHDFAEVHQHCALAGSTVDHIEMFPTDRPFDVRHLLSVDSAYAHVRAGKLPPATAPGLGIVLDLEQVARHSVRHASVGR
jgi:L-alanine-DL-glutamate epimerase-like enolase superfamily enzyme